MNLEEIERKYIHIPQELKDLKRWMCYKTAITEDGRTTKIPVTPFGGMASVSNPDTWCSFKIACKALENNEEYCGIGFVLGETENGINYFGIDIDNHGDVDLETFKNTSLEFLNTLNSYSELSHSGKGIHIICKGKLPLGQRRKNGVCVEMYDKSRFFTMTGKAIKGYQTLANRQNEIVPLWEKYLNNGEKYDPTKVQQIEVAERGIHLRKEGGISFEGGNFIEENRVALPTEKIFEKIRETSQAEKFFKLYEEGDMDDYGDDHSSADFALVNMLVFWFGDDIERIDRVFRQSALMRNKWDRPINGITYGRMIIEKAINSPHEVYHPTSTQVIKNSVKMQQEIQQQIEEDTKEKGIAPRDGIFRFDELGEPIIPTKTVLDDFATDDTGNANRFYARFGDIFRFNITANKFYYWNGMNWKVDEKDYIRKCVDKMIADLAYSNEQLGKKIDNLKKGDDAAKLEAASLEKGYKIMASNITRISNKAGKDALLNELKHLFCVSVDEKEFDTQEYLLNTESGVVDLQTGEIKPFSKSYNLSKNTHTRVSYEEPTTFLKFLHDVFRTEGEQTVEELIDTLQLALGYSLTGRKNKEYLFFLHGNGGNGKSTLISLLKTIVGDYGTVINSDLLLAKKGSSTQSTEFSFVSMVGKRMASSSEINEDQKFDEKLIKQLSGGEEMNAQYKYGASFSFFPTASVWMSTNHKPTISGTDEGIWRRIFLFPFNTHFTEDEKDVDMPQKLLNESDKILGWIIKGAVRLVDKKYKIVKSGKIQEEIARYRTEMDAIGTFIADQCTNGSSFKTKADTLFSHYVKWCNMNRETPKTSTKFGMELSSKGYKKDRRSDGFYYRGIKLNDDHRSISFANESEGD